MGFGGNRSPYHQYLQTIDFEGRHAALQLDLPIDSVSNRRHSYDLATC